MALTLSTPLSTKTQQERIEDAAAYLEGSQRLGFNSKQIAEAVLKAADEPRLPRWPSDESVRACRRAVGISARAPGEYYFEKTRQSLVAAANHDPVIQAAKKWYEYRVKNDLAPSTSATAWPTRDLEAAVREAGLA
jgi:hypothetical protein